MMAHNIHYTEEELQQMRLSREEEINLAKQFMQMPDDQKRVLEELFKELTEE